MSLLYSIFIAVSISMDAFAASVTCGMNNKGSRIGLAVKVGILFSSFQTIFFLIGWMGGEVTRSFVSSFGPYIAFILLSVIGIRMIHEARKNWDTGKECRMLTNRDMLMMAVATSIDALVVGLTFGVLGMDLLISAASILSITFMFSFLGVEIGHRLKGRLDRWAEVLAGLVLIGIGLKILIEGLI